MNARAQPLRRIRAAAPPASSPEDLRAREERIGAILLRIGRIDEAGLGRIVELQRRTNAPFARAARHLGLLSRDDIQTAIGVEQGIVAPDAGEGRLPPGLIVARRPSSPGAEAFRALRTRLVTGRDAERLNLFSIASIASAREVDHVAANLAAAFAQIKKRTLIVDADLRGSRLSRLFSLPKGPGLAEALRGDADLRDAIRPTIVANLSALTSGDVDASAHELLAGPLLDPTLAWMRAAYDVVILTTTRFGPRADAQFVWRSTGSAFIVSRRHEDRLPELRALNAALRQVDAVAFGAALAA